MGIDCTEASLTTPVENDVKIAEIMMLIDAQKTVIRREQYTANSIYAGEDETYAATIKIMAAQKEIERLNGEMAPFEAEYAARRWSRFFLVTNGNGHVHSSTSCSTCFVSTQFAWLPECSGMSEDEIVAEFGEKVCTVCFPSAPANPQHRAPGRRDREALDAKAAEKAAKLAAKLEKALLPDGSELRLQGWDRPKTLIAAQRALSSTLESLRWYGPTHPSAPTWVADIETLIDAISAKTGEAPESIRANVEAKVAKKIAKEQA